MGGGKLKYQESKDYLIKMAKEKADRGRPVPMDVSAAEVGEYGGTECGGYGMEDGDMIAALGK